MQGGVDEVIIQVLKSGSKSPEELKSVCVGQRGINEKTYHRHLANLVKRGKIQKINEYRVVEEKEANLDEVLNCIKRLKVFNNPDVLKEASLDLWRLCDGKRIVHHANVLTFIESSIVNPKFKSPRVLANFVHSLRAILSYENRRHDKDFDIISRLHSSITAIKNIVETQHDREVVGESIFFLAETGEEGVVDIILSLVKKLSKEEYLRHRNNIKTALYSPDYPLYKKQYSKINERVFSFMDASDFRLKNRGKDLNKAKRSMTSYS